jgi:hypothetical protein
MPVEAGGADMDTLITCHACHATVNLDPGATTQAAEVATFCAAHSRHSEGFGIGLVLQISPTAAPGSHPS